MSESKKEDGKVSCSITFVALWFLLVFLLALPAIDAQIQPGPPDTMTDLGNQSPEASAGMSSTTSGGTITYVNINATTQNPHWKAYVGNVTGRLALQDAGGNSIFDWNITSTEGEVYATRKSTIVDWDDLVCAELADIQSEEIELNMSSSSPDNIVNTFNKQSHAEFYAGLNQFAANSCNSTNLYVNSQESSDFEEVLLHDGTEMVYTALIEDSLTGFDGTGYDFQMLLPDSGLEGSQTPETYYFYVELI